MITIVMMATVAAFAGAGVPGSSLVTTLIVLNAIGLGPRAAAGIALVAAVDRPLDMCRSAVNTIEQPRRRGVGRADRARRRHDRRGSRGPRRRRADRGACKRMTSRAARRSARRFSRPSRAPTRAPATSSCATSISSSAPTRRTPMAIDYFEQMGGDALVRSRARVVFSLDHYSPPSTPKTAAFHDQVRAFARRHGADGVRGRRGHQPPDRRRSVGACCRAISSSAPTATR